MAKQTSRNLKYRTVKASCVDTEKVANTNIKLRSERKSFIDLKRQKSRNFADSYN